MNILTISTYICLVVMVVGGAPVQSAEATALSQNWLRNPGFELASAFNDNRILLGAEVILDVHSREEKTFRIPTEGWWCDQAQGSSIVTDQRHMGVRALQVQSETDRPMRVFSAPTGQLPAGDVTLSAWVMTKKTQAKLVLEVVAGDDQIRQIDATDLRQEAPLPADSGWTKLTLTLHSDQPVAARVAIEVTAGTVWADDLQIEAGAVATSYNVPPSERCRMTLDGVDEQRLPIWSETELSTRTVLLTNASTKTLDGDWEVRCGPWNAPGQRVLASCPGRSVLPGGTLAVPIDLHGLKPQAYLLTCVVRRGAETLIDSAQHIDLNAHIGGSGNSVSMLRTRAALRFVVAPAVDPRRIFGVGNGMLPYGWDGCNGDWWSGWTLNQFQQVRSEALTCSRGTYEGGETAYLLGAASLPLHRVVHDTFLAPELGTPGRERMMNPTVKDGIDLWQPDGWKVFLERAAAKGKENAANPLIVSQQMANETVFPFNDGICASPSADADFRRFCQNQHVDLATLNQPWRTKNTTWD